MEKPYYFNELSEKDKRKFYSQETFEGVYKIKVIIWITLALVGGIDMFFSGYIRTKILGRHIQAPDFIEYIIIVLIAALLYVISYARFFNRAGSKAIWIRVILNTIAGLMYGIYTFLLEMNRTQVALEAKTQDEWIRGYMTLSYAIYYTLIIQMISPVWFLKGFIPTCYYAGITAAFIKLNHEQMVWIIVRNLISVIYVWLLTWLAANFKWKLFLQSFSFETWNHLYRDMLDRNPSAIIVVDINGKDIYSNAEFKRIATESPTKFFQNVTNLKKRDFFIDTRLTEGPPSFTQLAFKESRRLLTFDENSPCSETRKLRGIQSESTFQNLEELLVYYRLLLENEKLENEDQIIFDGKYQKEHIHFSYEVIIRPLVDYKKIIVILNNTTSRDHIVALENNNQFKDQLLSSISHELRTPLNGTLGLLQVGLNDASVPRFVKTKFLLGAFRSGKLLSHLINDILDYSQLQTAKITLIHEVRSIKETIDYCYQLLEHSFIAKGLMFTAKIDERIPTEFKTDHDRLAQVILNLLTNSLKFTMQGGSVTVTAEWIDRNHAQIKVTDTGIGIHQNDIPSLLTDNINEGTTEKPKLTKGLGLGLKIANKIVKYLDAGKGRDIQVQTAEMKGSEFSFIIRNLDINVFNSKTNNDPTSSLIPQTERSPTNRKFSMENSLCEVPNERSNWKDMNYQYTRRKITFLGAKDYPLNRISTMTNLGTPRKSKHVLIVDDDPFNILALKSMLDQLGVVSDCANNGKEGVDKVMTHPKAYQLILMDCQMPVMDGYEASSYLVEKMKNGELNEIPIIGCTAFSAKNKIEECFNSGMKQVITKPVMKQKLQTVLEEYLA